MRFSFTIIPYFFISLVFAQLDSEGLDKQLQKHIKYNKPEFYTMVWNQEHILKKRETPIYIEVDSMGKQNVVKLVGVKNNPVLYFINVSTPVCADGECKLMEIKIYWDLLGDYAGFDRNKKVPLTKYDHDLFQIEDYKKLHLLLMDDNSILKRRKMEELIEKREVFEIGIVDAISGATISEVKESVVEGALYSCYTAWHIVHGKIKEALKSYTLSMMNYDIVIHMLHSNNANYQLFALNKLDDLKYEQNSIRIANIFESGIPLVRVFIINNLPNIFWERDDLQIQFWNSFDKLDVNTRSLLFEKLNKAPDYTMLELSQHLTLMTKNQLKIYLNEIKKGERINSKIRTNLELFANSDIEAQSYLVKQFLE
ncbi:MAG: hypothetical protein L3J34_13060 [Flavobacteriaceae bacterium]|nr:hypothetical protein [Flavobacteriaceae bacterium]